MYFYYYLFCNILFLENDREEREKKFAEAQKKLKEKRKERIEKKIQKELLEQKEPKTVRSRKKQKGYTFFYNYAVIHCYSQIAVIASQIILRSHNFLPTLL